MTPSEAAAVLSAFERADDYESLMWRVDMDAGPDVKLLALCSDVFFWATADAEEITAADLTLLEACLADLAKTGETYYLAELFAARKRKLRPQKPIYERMSEATAMLFDACCTAEERAEAEHKDAAWWIAVAHKIEARDGT
jgi:hypothetical protein